MRLSNEMRRYHRWGICSCKKVLIYENGFWINLSPCLPPSLLSSSPKKRWAQMLFCQSAGRQRTILKKMDAIGERGRGNKEDFSSYCKVVILSQGGWHVKYWKSSLQPFSLKENSHGTLQTNDQSFLDPRLTVLYFDGFSYFSSLGLLVWQKGIIVTSTQVWKKWTFIRQQLSDARGSGAHVINADSFLSPSFLSLV